MYLPSGSPISVLPFFPAVAAEGPRRREFAQSVTDHLFGHEHLQVDLAVVHHERVPHKLRHDRTRPGPGLDRILRPHRRSVSRTFRNNLGVTKGPFFSDLPIVVQLQHSRQGVRARMPTRTPSILIFNCPYRRDSPPPDDRLVRGFAPLAGRAALGQLAGGADRVTPALGPAFTAAVRMVDGVHGRAADVRPAAQPTLAARLAQNDAHVVGIADACRSWPGRWPARGEFPRWGD